MLSSIKRIFIILLILTVAAAAGIFLYSRGRTFYNDADEIGNTTGNIYNGGLFCEKDKTIYFSNDFDNGKLYAMNSDLTNIRKLSDDKAVYINADQNYIYYIRANNTKQNKGDGPFSFDNTGVYRVNQNGKSLKVMDSNPGAYLLLKGNNVYYQQYDVDIGLNLYRLSIDGKHSRLLETGEIIPSAVIGETIYFTFPQKNNINYLDMQSFTSHTALKGSYGLPVYFGNYIYYIDTKDGNNLYRMNKDGSEPELLAGDNCSAFNITNSGKFLYYQVDASKDSSIWRLNLETMTPEKLLDGKYKQISVTEKYVFFKDYKNKNIYVLEADGLADINTFNPS